MEILATLLRIPEGGLKESKGVIVGSEQMDWYTSKSKAMNGSVNVALLIAVVVATCCLREFGYSEMELARETLLF